MTPRSRRAVFLTLFLPLLIGCGGFSHNANDGLAKNLDLYFMHSKLGRNEIDLSEDAACPGTLSLKIVNAEQSTQNHVFFRVAGHKHYIVPKEFVNLVVGHLKDVLRASWVKTDDNSAHQVWVSFEDAQVQGTWSFESNVRLKFEIPEISYSQTYTGIEGSADAYHALAFGVHHAAIKFSKDPVFQNYVKCRQSD